MKTIDMTDDEIDRTFQDILDNEKDDPNYSELIGKFNRLKEESTGIMKFHGDVQQAFKLGMKAGAVENRILKVYDAKQEQ